MEVVLAAMLMSSVLLLVILVALIIVWSLKPAKPSDEKKKVKEDLRAIKKQISGNEGRKKRQAR